MDLEKRTRVEIFVPTSSDSLLSHWLTEWLAEELAYARGGSTLSTPFTGVYLSSAQGDLIRDTVQVLFCDFPLDLENRRHNLELAEYLGSIKSLMRDVLNEEEIWIICHSVMRVTNDSAG